jgi:NADPH2:quinone reductase
MRAWIVRNFGDYHQELTVGELPDPVADGSNAVIEVKATGVNFADILNIAGQYQIKAPFPFSPGMEAAGVVVQAGPESPYKPGDRVVTVNVVGGCAGRAIATEFGSYPIPPEMSFAQAAAFTINYQTGYFSILRRGRLKAGETVLVHAGASGVGTAAIQLCKAHGATVIATASSGEKLDVCRQCGADHVINYKDGDFVPAVRELTQGRGVDVVYDPVGGDTFDKSTKVMAFEGRILVIGFASGRIPEVAANRLLLKNIDVAGFFLGGYSMYHNPMVHEAQETLYGLFRSGKLAPVLYKEYPFAELPEALNDLEKRRTYGKPILLGTD